MAQIPENERTTFALAILLIVVFAAAVIALVYTGASIVFYALGIVTLVLGFYITYTIPKLERQQKRRKR
ncbi:MAG: hypothetical protein KGH59_00280 [Candidatus Micrarchaeota archaeon]|nr:hypothetical protein [Candidatus Micrarchaeota archaeon]MDE1804210.1 hypothetical protein [Candidatus Micrarchaeota archaeon]MDE1846666.1 hypothetical protein [Candidatus Micrarchaeota archaeon]